MNTKYQSIFFATVFLVISVLSVLIFQSFLIPLILSAIVAILVAPLHQKILQKMRSKNLAAVTTVLLIVILILVPLAFLANRIISEAQGLYLTIASGEMVSVDAVTHKVETVVKSYIPDFKFNVREYLAGFSAWILGAVGGIFSGTLDLFVKFILGLIALFYFIRDGEEFKEQLSSLSPLSQDKDDMIAHSIKSSIGSVVLGSLVVALVQGVLSGIGFAIFGVPNSVLWGTVAGIAALVPGVGTALVWIPAVIYLFFYGSYGVWVGQIIWSIVFVGLVDNVLAPFIINKGVNIHPLFILFSILGGLQYFGPEGFLLGPLSVSLLFVLVKVIKTN